MKVVAHDLIRRFTINDSDYDLLNGSSLPPENVPTSVHRCYCFFFDFIKLFFQMDVPNVKKSFKTDPNIVWRNKRYGVRFGFVFE